MIFFFTRFDEDGSKEASKVAAGGVISVGLGKEEKQSFAAKHETRGGGGGRSPPSLHFNGSKLSAKLALTQFLFSLLLFSLLAPNSAGRKKERKKKQGKSFL